MTGAALGAMERAEVCVAAAQLLLVQPDLTSRPAWSHEGEACVACAGGHFYMVAASAPCTCGYRQCRCLAEGYARCDSCGALRQVFPREMVIAWEADPGRAA
jgi:hypothetical protein